MIQKPAMPDTRDAEALKALGSGRPAPDEIVRLYHRAFREFGAQALWSRRASAAPTIAQALVVAESLRREGDLKCRALALEIEQACRAAL
jgi:hypothetical protein